MLKVLDAHPLHVQRSCDAEATWIVPRDCWPEPLNVCGDPVPEDDPLVTVDVEVTVRVTVLLTVRVVVAWITFGA